VNPIKVLAVASEMFPFVKTGGLADVVGALPQALADEGVEIVTLIPGYPSVLRAHENAAPAHTFHDLFGGPARLLGIHRAQTAVLVLDAPHLYDRPGSPYLGPDGKDWPDNAQRFAALAWVAAQIADGAVSGYEPDLLHAHDWQAGLAPAFVRYGGSRRIGTVMTVHNLAFQGTFPRALLEPLGLPAAAFTIDGVEYYGMIGFLKAGLALADRITTVSPTYATEIRTPEGGMGLDGLLRARAHILHGILNGIDETVWNPATDPMIAVRYSDALLPHRAANKSALQERFGLVVSPTTLLFGMISRLTTQKGPDLLLNALEGLLRLGAQLAVLGAGDSDLEKRFVAAAAGHAGQVGCVIGYDEALAHQIQAGVDALLVPSRFEPCGLTQLCALRYGALPVVTRVGGLADTVIDANDAALAAGTGSGIQFAPATSELLQAALERTARLWRQPALWQCLQHNAMRSDVSWRRPAAHYAALYREILAEHAA
jgi:starch synthase